MAKVLDTDKIVTTIEKKLYYTAQSSKIELSKESFSSHYVLDDCASLIFKKVNETTTDTH